MIRSRRVTVLPLAAAATWGCSSDDGPSEPQTGELVVQARSAAAFPLSAAGAGDMAPGDVSSYVATFYRFYMAESADCTSPTLLGDYDAAPVTADLLTDPTLFTVTGTAGSYDCIVMRISDVFTFVPETSFGPCVAGTSYTVDTYRDEHDDFLDIDGNPTTGTGSDASPVDDQIYVFFTTNPSAVAGRGYSTNQIVPLENGAEIPGTSTLVYDVLATDQSGLCRSGSSGFTFR